MDSPVADYLLAAHVDDIPAQLDEPHHRALHAEERAAALARVRQATEIWCSAGSDALRLEQLRAVEVRDDTRTVLMRQLDGAHNRLPETEIEYALDELGLLAADNGVLSPAEKAMLDHDGYLDLGCLIDEAELRAMRVRYDEAVRHEGRTAGHEVSQMPGIGRVSGTVLKAMNRDGLLDVVVMHPRLLAAVRHVLGVHFKYSSSNYHCPLPGYGHQPIHADWAWGVREPEVVNAIWMLDDFTADNGPTRLVPGSHLSGVHPYAADIDNNAPVAGEITVTGRAGTCIVYNAHLWHGGTQNCSMELRRAQHAFFTRSIRRPQMDALALLDEQVRARLGRVERAILDLN